MEHVKRSTTVEKKQLDHVREHGEKYLQILTATVVR